MKELSLFTGAGGGLLGTHLLGWEACGYVEWNKYCQQVIAARIKDGFLPAAPIFTDVREFVQSGAAEQYRGIADVVSAGFPCQPFSVAGKQAGADDERNMWPATRDVIRIVQPESVLLENVPGLISAGYLETVIGDLADLGYVGKWGVIGASDVGAPHRRKRLWIVAHAKSKRHGARGESRNILEANGRQVGQMRPKFTGTSSQSENMAHASGTQRERNWSANGIHKKHNVADSFGDFAPVADAECFGQQGQGEPRHASNSKAYSTGQAGNAFNVGWWQSDPGDDPESGVGRVAPRMANRMDRLTALGNGQVCQVVRSAWELLA